MLKNGKHIVGATYHCSYWNYDYKVLAVDGCKVTVELVRPSPIEGMVHNTIGDVWSHYTALDEKDRLIKQPPVNPEADWL